VATIRIGLITIGQSPRDDVVPDMMSQLPFKAEPLQRGAIDGLTLTDVQQMTPGEGEPWFVSRMADGAEVRLARRELIPRMQRCVKELESEGVELIVPLCASDWSDLSCSVPFINSGKALSAITSAMLRPGGVLGVIMPTREQAELADARYAKQGVRSASTFAQPYTSTDEQIQQSVNAGRLMSERSVDLVYMACMGHTREMRAAVRSECKKPTLSANSMIAGLISQALA
jgi:protein AroM